MLKFFRRIFGNESAAAAVSEPVAPAAPARKAATPVPAAAPAEKRPGGMDVASISLRAVLEKFPPDLAAIVNQLPDSETKIVLPVNTIMKQLASGAVKMSLASLLRQAPPGTFRKTDAEDKRLIDVPLAEIFKTINPSRLQRRVDQRQYDVPQDAAGLFGPSGNTRSVASPGAPSPAATPSQPVRPAAAGAEPTPEPAPAAIPTAGESKIEPQKILRMPGIASGPASIPAGGSSDPTISSPRVAATAKAEGAAESSRFDLRGELTLPFVELASAWPEGVRNELSILSGDTKVVVPVSAVGPGLQKGRITFPWSQVRLWFRPPISSAVSIPDELELTFPLRMVAPAFVAATGATKRREAQCVDDTLPDFFGPTAAKSVSAEEAQSAPAEPAQPEATCEMPAAFNSPGHISAPIPAPVPHPSVETPSLPMPELKLSMETDTTASVPSSGEAILAPIESGSETGSACAEGPAIRMPIEEAAAPVATPPVNARTEPCEPSTLGELFDQPAKSSWTPAELVSHTCGLPGVAGAVVALEEGLVVAQQLPEGFAAETFAAFMPQFFGRLETYTHEMKLGDTDEITIRSSNAPCHLVRNGKVFFATLGRVGEKLPAGLRLVAAELAGNIR